MDSMLPTILQGCNLRYRSLIPEAFLKFFEILICNVLTPALGNFSGPSINLTAIGEWQDWGQRWIDVAQKSSQIIKDSGIYKSLFFTTKVTPQFVKSAKQKKKKKQTDMGVVPLCVYREARAWKEVRGSGAELIIFITIHSTLSLSYLPLHSRKYTIYPHKLTHIHPDKSKPSQSATYLPTSL